MNPLELRAQLLLSQERYAQAADMLKEALADDPNNARLHAQRGISLAQIQRLAEADDHARQAVALAPADAVSHRALAFVLLERRAWRDAFSAVQSALSLEPDNAENYMLLARVYTGQHNWPEVLRAAEQGLALDPHNRGCQNLRALAQLGMGRVELTGEAIELSLASRPEDAWAHACQGWVHLLHHRPRQATESFRESLRLSPSLDWARLGLIQSLKAHHWFYRVTMLSRDEVVTPSGGSRGCLGQMRRMMILGMWVIAITCVGGSPIFMFDSAPPPPPLWFWIVLGCGLYGFLAVVLANPLADALLLADPRTRHVLSPREVHRLRLVASALLLPVPMLALAIFLGSESQNMASAVMLALVAIPASLIYGCEPLWPRRVAWLLVALHLALGLCSALPLERLRDAADQRLWLERRATAHVLYLHATWIFSIALLRLSKLQPRR